MRFGSSHFLVVVASTALIACSNAAIEPNSHDASPAVSNQNGAGTELAPVAQALTQPTSVGQPPSFTSGPANTLKLKATGSAPIANFPWQFGRPFRQGEIPGCPTLLIDGQPLPTQADVKSRFPDGSVRFAILSAVVPSVPAATAATITFRSATDCNNAGALTRDAMLEAGRNFDAVIRLNGGAGGIASARSMVAAGSFRLWTQGPIVTTAIVADHLGKAFDIGPDSNRSLRPIFEVQFWPSINRTRVRAVLEAVDTEKIQSQTYDVALESGATSVQSVYAQTSVPHGRLMRWTRTFWIGSTEPAPVDVDYSVAYLASTGAIPNFNSSLRIDPALKGNILSAWNAAQKSIGAPGNWERAMPAAGGRADIGPFPTWDTAWLFDGSAALRNVALGNADLAGSWPMHMREGSPSKRADRAQAMTAVGLPVSGYARPTLAIGDLTYAGTVVADRARIVGATESHGWSPDNAHQPQPHFVPYLLTGEHYYKEQMQFWAAYALLDKPWGLYGLACDSKNVSAGYLGIGGELRGTAWGLRTLAEAAWATPDEEQSMKSSLTSAVEDVITRLEGVRGVVRGNNRTRPDWQWANSAGDCSAGRIRSDSVNPLRYWEENGPYSPSAQAASYHAPWQYGFMMYALGRATELGFPANELRSWFSRFWLGAVASSERAAHSLAAYRVPIRDATTSRFFTSWTRVADIVMAEDPTIVSVYWDRPAACTYDLNHGYSVVMLAALASSYGQADSASAWSSFGSRYHQRMCFEKNPKWAILPR